MPSIFGVLAVIGLSLASASGSDALLTPQLLSRDLPVIIEAMDLDSQQAAILDDLLGEYLAQFETERSKVDATLQSLDTSTLHEAWVPSDWSDRHQVWRGIRAEAAEIDNAADARVWLETQQDWARDEMETLLRTRPAPPPSTRTAILNDWLTRRSDLRDGLVRDVRLLLDTRRGSHWGMVEAAIARQRTPFKALFPGEALDLGKVAEAQFEDGGASPPAVQRLFAPYQRAWAEAALRRDAELAALVPLQLDAVERKDMLGQLLLARREASARRALVDANLDWYDRFTAAMPAGAVNDFQRAVNQAAHPDIFLPSLPERLVNHALASDDIDSAIGAALLQSRTRFGGPRLAVAANERAARRSAAPRRLVARAEQRAMADVFGPTALFQLERIGESDPLSRATTLATRRRSIDAAWLQHVHELLGPATVSAIPDDVKLPPKALRPHLVDEQGEPLRLILLP